MLLEQLDAIESHCMDGKEDASGSATAGLSINNGNATCNGGVGGSAAADGGGDRCGGGGMSGANDDLTGPISSRGIAGSGDEPSAAGASPAVATSVLWESHQLVVGSLSVVEAGQYSMLQDNTALVVVAVMVMVMVVVVGPLLWARCWRVPAARRLEGAC